jgi:hypothetical protein
MGQLIERALQLYAMAFHLGVGRRPGYRKHRRISGHIEMAEAKVLIYCKTLGFSEPTLPRRLEAPRMSYPLFHSLSTNQA